MKIASIDSVFIFLFLNKNKMKKEKLTILFQYTVYAWFIYIKQYNWPVKIIKEYKRHNK